MAVGDNVCLIFTLVVVRGEKLIKKRNIGIDFSIIFIDTNEGISLFNIIKMTQTILFGHQSPTDFSKTAFLDHVEQYALNARRGQLFLIYPRTAEMVLFPYMDYVVLIHFNVIEAGGAKLWTAKVRSF